MYICTDKNAVANESDTNFLYDKLLGNICIEIIMNRCISVKCRTRHMIHLLLIYEL